MLSAIRFLFLAVCDRGFTFVLPDVQIWCVTDGKDLGKDPNFINTAIETKQPTPSPGLRSVLGSQPGPLRSVRESSSEGKPVVGVQPCAWEGGVGILCPTPHGEQMPQVLLFALVFYCCTNETPHWPFCSVLSECVPLLRESRDFCSRDK